jgi:hypothetical protein
LLVARSRHILETLIGMRADGKGIRVAFDVYPDREIPAEIKEVSNEASSYDAHLFWSL